MSRPELELECERQLDAASYVLGALEQPASYEAHLADCAICQAEVAELQLVVDALPTTVPPATASEVLRGRVLATVRSEAELLRASGRQADEAPRRSTRRALRRWPALAVSASLALGAAAVIVAIALSAGSPARERVTPGQITAGVPGASASLRQRSGHAELVVSGLPQPAPGKIYEVWLSRGSGSPQPTDALFGVTTRGRGSVDVPGNLQGVKEVMVTSEPQGGSILPTSTPLIRISLRA